MQAEPDTEHLDEATLKAFLQGRYPPERTEQIAQHLEGCTECGVALEAIDSAPDIFQEMLREASNSEEAREYEMTIDASPDQASGTQQPSLFDGGLSDSRIDIQVGYRFARYRILSPLGRGRMGVVYEAKDTELDRRVALKLIAPDRVSDSGELARFHNEARSAARLGHPGIVQVYEFSTWQGRSYCAMELVEGEDLAKVFKREEFSPQRSAELVRDVAEALHYAHSQGVIHRDLKPANILITSEGQPKIADFGLAKQIDLDASHTIDGTVLGSPAYMPPEQAEGATAEIGPWSDVFSLGAVLYEALAGRPPYKADSILKALEAACESNPPRPSQCRKGINGDLETICLKCMRKERRERYESADELARDLDRFIAGKPIQARRVGPAERVRKFAKRRPALSALTLMLLAVTAAWGAWLWSSSEQRQAELQKARYKEAISEAAIATVSNPTEAVALLEDPQKFPSEQREAAWRVLRANADWRVAVPASGAARGAINCVASAAGSGRCLVGRRDGRVDLVELSGAAEASPVGQMQHAVNALAASADGRLVAAADLNTAEEPARGGVKLFRVDRSAQPITLSTADEHTVNQLAFSPDGRWLAAACSGAVLRVWPVAGGEPLEVTLTDGAGSLFCCAFSVDSKEVFAGSSRNRRVYSWSIGEGRLDEGEAIELGPAATVGAEGIHALGVWEESQGELGGTQEVLAAGDAGGVLTRFSRADSGKFLKDATKEGMGPIRGVVYSPRLNALGVISAAFLKPNAAVDPLIAGESFHVLNASGLTQRHGFWRQSLGFSSLSCGGQGQWVVADAEGSLLCWNDPIAPVASASGATPWRRAEFVGGSDLIAALDEDDAAQFRGVDDDQPLPWLAGKRVTALSASANSGRLAWAEKRRTLMHATVEGDQLAGESEIAPPGLVSVRDVSLSHRGRYLATVGYFSEVSDLDCLRLWDLEENKPCDIETPGGGSESEYVEFATGAAILAERHAQGVRVWDCPSGGLLSEVAWESPPSGFAGLAISPGGRRLALVSNQSAVETYDVTSGEQIGRFVAPVQVTSLAYSAGGGAMAVGLSDGRFSLYSPDGRRELLTLRVGTGAAVTSLRFSGDGRRLLVATSRGVFTWRLAM